MYFIKKCIDNNYFTKKVPYEILCRFYVVPTLVRIGNTYANNGTNIKIILNFNLIISLKRY